MCLGSFLGPKLVGDVTHSLDVGFKGDHELVVVSQYGYDMFCLKTPKLGEDVQFDEHIFQFD